MAAAQGSYSVVFAVIDKGSAQLEGINKRLASMQAPLKKLNTQFEKFGNLSGISGLARGLTGLGRTAVGVLKTITSFIPVLGAIAGAGILAGIYRLVESTADWAQNLKITANLLNMSSHDLAVFQSMAKMAGMSVTDMDGAMSGMQQTMLHAFTNNDPAAFAIFQRMGVSVNQLKGSFGDILPTVIKFWATLSPLQRGALLDQMPALRGLTKILDAGMEAYDRNRRAAEKNAPTKEQIEKSERLAAAYNHLSSVLDDMTKSLAGEFAPALERGLSWLSTWIEAHHDSIIAFFTSLPEKFDALVGGLKGIKEWGETAWKWLENLKAKLDPIAQAFGGWGVVIAGAIALYLAAPLAGVIGQLAALALAIPGVAEALALLAIPTIGGPAMKAMTEGINSLLPFWLQDDIAKKNKAYKPGDKLPSDGQPVTPEATHHPATRGSPRSRFSSGVTTDQERAEKKAADEKALTANKQNSRDLGQTLTDWWESHFGGGNGAGGLATKFDATGHGGGGTSGPPLSTVEADKHTKIMYDTWKKAGWSDEKIAAGLAEAQIEGGFNPDIHERGGSNHVGMFQHDATRQAAFRAKYGHGMDDVSIPREQRVKEQAEFADLEQRGGGHGGAGIDAAVGAGAKANAWNAGFEVSGKERGDASLAEKWLKKIRDGQFNDKPAAVTAPAPGKTAMNGDGSWLMHIIHHDPDGNTRIAVDSQGNSPRPRITTTAPSYGVPV